MTAPHPLNWAAYLRRSLVLSSAPTALTLLVVAAHCHALCRGGGGGGAPVVWLHHHGADNNETSSSSSSSVLGSVFALSGFFFNSTSYSCIPVPWNQHPQQQPLMEKFKLGEDDGDDDDAGNDNADSNESNRQKETSSQDSSLMHLNSILRASVMKDPFTVAYGAWEFFTGPVEQIRIEPVVSKKEASSSSSCEWMMKVNRRTRKRLKEKKEGSGSSSSSEDAVVNVSTSWLNICAMHTVGMAGIFCALLPSLFVKRELLACNAAINCLQATAWPLLHSCALLFGLSWVVCSAIHHLAGLPELAQCASMHLVAQLVSAFVDMAGACPLPPIYAPVSGTTTGMGFSLGLLLLCISQIEEDAEDASNSFYMNHAWTAWGVVFVVR